MSTQTEYAERVVERYGTVVPLGKPDVSAEPEVAAPQLYDALAYARAKLERHKDALVQARRRVHEETINKLLRERPEAELLAMMPYGKPRSIDEVISKEPRLALVGKAGAGKSSALRYLVGRRPVSRIHIAEEGATEEQNLVPVVISMPSLGDRSLPQYLVEDAGSQLSLSLEPDFFVELLKTGHALICVDGLDEIVEPAARAAAVQQIERWVGQFPLCHYVVTSRSDAYVPALDPQMFNAYELVPWTHSVVAVVEKAWNDAVEGWQAQDPERTYYTARSRLLAQLALAMQAEGHREASLDEAKEWLVEAALADKTIRLNRRQAPKEIDQLLEEGASQLGLLQSEEGVLRFSPRVLQDILAARALEALCVEKGVNAAWSLIGEQSGASQWQETGKLLVQFLAQDDPKMWARFTARILEAGERDALETVSHHYLLWAAAALEGDSKELDRATRRRILDGLMGWMLDAQAVGRLDAFKALGKAASDPYASEQILAKVGSESLDVWGREALVLLVGTIGGHRAGDAIDTLKALIDNAEETDSVRLAAVAALGALGGALPAEDARMRTVGHGMLERVRDPEKPIDLRAALIESQSATLAKTLDPEIVEVLVALSQGENGEEEHVPYSVQIGAAQAVCDILPSLDDSSLTERLWALVHDEQVDDAVRTRFAEALGKLGNAAEAGRVLASLAQSSKVYPPGQRGALEALGRLGTAEQEVIDQVITIAQTRDRQVKDFVRLAACITLGQLGQIVPSIQNLLMLIADKSIYRSTRNEALSYLGGLSFSGDAQLDDATISVLQIWMTEDNTTEDVRENAMESLCRLKVGREDVIRDMIGIIQDKGVYPRVRRSAASSLMRLSIEQKDMVVDAMEATFYDPEEQSDLLRVPLAQLLYVWGQDEHALEYLKAAAEQSYMAAVRYKAAMVLGDVGQMDEAIAALIKLAQAPEIVDTIRQDSLRALGLWAVANQQVVEVIESIAQNADLEPNVRDEAYKVLRSIVVA